MSSIIRAAHAAHRGRRRFLPFVWTASAVSAAVLVLGVNGTLSSWTTAIVNNSSNTAATAQGVILKEVNGANTCVSSQGTGATNTYTCATINKYGGATTPLTPGNSQQVDVVFTNSGSAAASSFKLDPTQSPGCTQTPTANAAAVPAINNLCTAGAGELGVAVSCNDGLTFGANPVWSDLKYVSGAPGAMPVLTHTASLAAGANWTCRFTVALNANANPNSQGITINQPLQWTLTQ
jgi:hypothetical protein